MTNSSFIIAENRFEFFKNDEILKRKQLIIADFIENAEGRSVS